MMYTFARSRQRGQSLVEAIVVIPVFGAVILGMLQAVLFYRAKSVVDYAALQAARSGATHFAQPAALKQGLVRGLLPLYTHDTKATALLKAYLVAQADIATGAAKIQVISPDKAMFDAWKEKQYDGVEGIPNDSLAFRGSQTKAGVTVQDANLLKIRVRYDYPMIVPVIDRLLAAMNIARLDPVRSLAQGHKVYSLPIVTQAIVRMQTPIRDVNLLPDAASGSGGGTGGAGGGTGGGTGSGGSGGGGSTGGGSGGGDGGGTPPDHVCV
ncbi:TadE/TadG family type IV pilus assembly protein [Oleiagrimonas soli]|uniref:Putative membrane protein YgcG n=1 Tax=Oleiagrimonas soli TaxID=1543381 RepID=A0A099CYX8_9GAMM|nr:TadE family protein [Oleiagrimonas soli]KGI78944.1 hypothetical protein LF63_0101685 [Oleiagrimonas soli]MBB6184550.1 putative membrane protein YgcG [Oleiagrimonas soli]